VAWDSTVPGEHSILGLARWLVEGEHDYQTIVVDHVNRVEVLLWRWICQKNRIDSIEALGYGKGYIQAAEQVNLLIDLLQEAKRRRNMHWIALSHQKIATAKDATQDDYERAAMALHEKSAGAWEGAASTIIYAEPEIHTFDHLNKDKQGERRKVELTGRTSAFIKPGRGIQAGSRDLVKSPMALSWAEYERQAKEGESLKIKLYRKRQSLSIEDQASLDLRLASAGYSWEAYEKEIES
jgi:hypothetical protein